MTQPALVCCHGVSLHRTCLCCGEPSAEWDALVKAGVYDCEGYTPKERKALARKAAKA